MFTKSAIRDALSVAIDINSDATERICNFSLTGVSDGIMLNVYPHGKRGGFGSCEHNWIYTAYETEDGYKAYKREYRAGIVDGQSFTSLKEMLKDVKGASDEKE